MRDEAEPRRGTLLGWSALVMASTLVTVGVRLIYDVPDDVRYRHATVVFAVLVSAVQLAAVLTIESRADLRDVLALRPPTSSKHAAIIGAAVIVGTYTSS